MPVSKGPKGFAQEMHKFKEGKLHSGSKHGPVVKDRKQAMAIAASESGMGKAYSSGGMVGGSTCDERADRPGLRGHGAARTAAMRYRDD